MRFNQTLLARIAGAAHAALGGNSSQTTPEDAEADDEVCLVSRIRPADAEGDETGEDHFTGEVTLEPELVPWKFSIVAPDHPDGIVTFNLAMSEGVVEALKNCDPDVWSLLIAQLDEIVSEAVEEI